MYHPLVEAGQEHFLKATGVKVKVVKVDVSGKLEVILPDHYEDGQPVGQGGTVRVKKGDFLAGSDDGMLIGVAAERYGELLSAAPVGMPTIQ